MKYIIFIILALFCSFPSTAETRNIIFHKTSGDAVIVPLNDAAEISFTGTQINIGLLSMNLDDILRYEFVDLSGIDDIILENSIDNILVEPRGIITFYTTMQCSNAHIFSANGIECPAIKRGNILDFSSQPAGIYVVSVGNKSLKIAKK